MIQLVDLKKQYLSIKDDIDQTISSILENSSFIGGEELKNFEKNFANYCQAKHCLGLANGTVAVELALKAYGIGHGDEVITVPNTFIATTESIHHVGAEVKFVDVDPETYLMDPKLIEQAITSKTKAIIPVHLYGQICNMKEIKEIAEKYDLKIIEDTAQGHGAEYFSKKAPICDVATYSFFPAKILGCYGDGGCLVTNDDELAEKISLLKDHGRTNKYEHKILGHNYRLDTLQAAILNTKLKYLDSWIEKRRKNAKTYNKLLEGHVKIPKELANNKHSYYMYVIRSEKRDALSEHLKQNNIATGVHYPIPLHKQQAYTHLPSQSHQHTEKAAKEILSLPMYPELSEEEIQFICEKIINF